MQGTDVGIKTKRAHTLSAYDSFFARAEEDLEDTHQRYLMVPNEMRKINIQKTNMEVNLHFLRSLKSEWKKTAKRNRSTSGPSDKAISGDHLKCFKCGKRGHFAKECRITKKKDYNHYIQKAQLAKQKEQGIVLMSTHDHWLEDSDDSE
ncbi:unnamed protein product [Cuscuta europaea]|uniref:CCHC-type domain-containing protein n=1 Tax=Cuscuta europaea TaxID=41803 RepID=A0A9P0YJQ0_CUSEU|nr:unnamed protein product [Cuscuta europaea]